METKELEAATIQIIDEYRRFADEVLPQAGSLVLAIGPLNEGLIFAAKIRAELT